MGKKKSKRQKQKRNARRKYNRQHKQNNLPKQSINVESSVIELPKIKKLAEPVNENKNKKEEKKQVKVSTKRVLVPTTDVFSKLFKNKSQNNVNKKKIVKDKNKVKFNYKNLFKTINKYLHIAFNTIIIIVFVTLFVGLNVVEVFKPSFIYYICGIFMFLTIIAISYNKHISGRIFTIILCLFMIGGISKLQYTYDFIRILNNNNYEYKEYYLVTFDNSRNKTIYNINNKKIGLLKDNSTNIERVLDTKLDNIKYVSYTDQNNLINDFYDSKVRALIVTDNQYKYLKNNKINQNTDVKILYTFKANTPK